MGPGRGIKKGAAFTLIELVLVVALIALVVSATFPRIRAAFEVGALDSAVRAIMMRVEAARRRAVFTQKEQYLVVDFSARKVEILKQGGGKGSVPGAYKIPDGVHLTDVEFPELGSQSSGVARLRISPEGYLQYAAIHLEDNDRRVTLFLEPFLGRVRMEQGYHEMCES